MRARQYVSDVVGGEGAVLAHHAKPEIFERKFKEAHIRECVPVQKFLEKIQSDKEGYVSRAKITHTFYVAFRAKFSSSRVDDV